MPDRDERGRFAKGNVGSPGRKPKAVEDDFLALIDSAVSADDWRAIIRRACDLAKRGDTAARAWLTDRRYGKPRERTENTGADGGPLIVTIIDEVDVD